MFNSRAKIKDLENEIKGISNPEQLQKVALKLLDENNQLVRQCQKQRSALSQIHLLEKQLYNTLQNKMSETRLLKKCLAISQYTKDNFLKKVVIPGLSTFDDECQEIFSSLSREPSITFLSQTLTSSASNLLIVKLVVEYYLDKIYSSELEEKPQLEECLACLNKILHVMKRMKSFRIFGGSNGAGSQKANNAIKRKNLHGESQSVTAANKKKKVYMSENFAGPSNNGEHSSSDFHRTRRLIVKLVDCSQTVSDLDSLDFKQTNLFKDKDKEYKDFDDVECEEAASNVIESCEEAASNVIESCEEAASNAIESCEEAASNAIESCEEAASNAVEVMSYNSSPKLNVDDANNFGSNVISKDRGSEEQDVDEEPSIIFEAPIKPKVKPMEGGNQEQNFTPLPSTSGASSDVCATPHHVEQKQIFKSPPTPLQKSAHRKNEIPARVPRRAKPPPPPPPSRSREEEFLYIFGPPIIVKDAGRTTATKQQGNSSKKK